MMRFHSSNNSFFYSKFFQNFHSNNSVSPFYFMANRFSNIVNKSRLFTKFRICSRDLLGNCFSDIGHFN